MPRDAPDRRGAARTVNLSAALRWSDEAVSSMVIMTIREQSSFGPCNLPASRLAGIAGTLRNAQARSCDNHAHAPHRRIPSLTRSLLFVVSGSECCSASVEVLLEALLITITMLGTILRY